MEEKITKVLESIGLHKNEIIMYLDLIKVGKSSAIDISKRTKIHRPNVYDTIEKLIEKGVVSENIENNRKIFYPVPPRALFNYLKQKEYELEKIIPTIESIHNKPQEERKVSVFEGLPSVRNIINHLLELENSILAYGLPIETEELLGGFLIEFHKKRLEKKISMKLIYNRGAEKRIKHLNDLEYTQARYFPSSYDANATTIVCGDKVIFVFFEEPISTIVIKNMLLAETYKRYFLILWEEAKMHY